MKSKLYFILLLSLIMSSGSPAAAITIIPSSHLYGEPDAATVNAAIEGFKNLNNREKKAKLKLAKKELKAFKKAKKKGAAPDTNTLLLVIIAILLPPLAVYLHEGEINNKFWITLLLFLLGLAGGFLFSWFALLAAIVYALVVVLGEA